MFEAGFDRSHGWRRPKCRLRGARPDPLNETREPAKRAVCRGRLGVVLPKRAVFPVTRPSPKGGEVEGSAPRPHGGAMPIKALDGIQQRNDISSSLLALPKGRGDQTKKEPRLFLKNRSPGCGFY